MKFSVAHVRTPIGLLEVTGSTKGVRSITFMKHQPKQLRNDAVLRDVVAQLHEYFNGERDAFHSLQLEFPATDFQQDIWDELMTVPFGEVVTYGELAARAGHKGAARAVGTAMNVNPLPVIIPCHRVLPADRTLGQYAYGASKKFWLLQHEKTAVVC